MRTIEIAYNYCGWESTSKSEHYAAIGMMEEAIEEGDENAIVEHDDDGDFGGILTIKTTSSLDEFDDEDYITMLENYSEPGYDNALGGYYSFELVKF